MVAQAQKQAPPEPALPRLRSDLRLIQGARDPFGAPTWTIHDPAGNRFFRIGWAEAEMIGVWRTGMPISELLAEVNRKTPVTATAEQAAHLLEFLAGNQLLTATTDEGIAALVEKARGAKKGLSSQLLHNYLFFRLPLLRPHRLLSAVGPKLGFLFSRWFWTIVTILGALGLFMVLRRWDEFFGSFKEMGSTRALLFYGAAIVFTKIIHEFAHGLTAWRYGVRVPSMGVAFMVLWPVMYTDATGAWKLSSRMARLRIAGAGIMAEMAIAAVAVFCWAFLADGPARSAAFFLATTSWVMTLVINLNPLMRFDGYYLLSDAWDMPNLHDRAFKFGRWFLRKTVLGLDDPAPEEQSRKRTFQLILLAYAVWIYRIVLYLGIALMVYHFVVKLVGILLMIVEVIFFLAMPIYREMKIWWERREDVRLNLRTGLSLAGLLVVMPALLFIPLPVGVDAPAVLRASAKTGVFSPENAMVAEVFVKKGDHVEAGQPILRLASPPLESAIKTTEISLVGQRQQAQGFASDRQSRGQLELAMREVERSELKLATLQQRYSQLQINAPMAGRIVELNSSLKTGLWVGRDATLAIIADTDRAIVDAYLPEAMLVRLNEDEQIAAKFLPDDPDRTAVKAHVVEISDAPLGSLDAPLLASIYGGPVPATRNDRDALIPSQPLYRARLEPEAQMALDMEISGRVRFSVKPVSLFSRMKTAVTAVLIRESGF